MYYLSSNQSDRINFDSANGMYFDDQIEQYTTGGGVLSDIDRNTFDAWFDVDLEQVDDKDEALSRAWSTFQERLAYAKRAAFAEALEESEFGMAVPYAGAYTAYVSEDVERDGYHITYCKDELPPHGHAHAASEEEAARVLAEIADLTKAYAIEAE
jgi:hypothetical protein